MDDPSRPDARVTHGPSCQPGGLVVEIRAGTAPYSARLATTRRPAGEDQALLAPGGLVVLRSGDVAYGETIDGRIEYVAQDGSGVAFADELLEYSFTRPSQEDCDAITEASPESASPEPSSTEPAPVPTEAATTTPTPDADGGIGGRSAPSASSAPATAPAESRQSSAPAPSIGEGRPGAPTFQVAAGGTVTLLGGGFLPGEEVTIRLQGDGAVLGTAVAGTDGTVRTEVRIPSRTEAGAARVDLVGGRSDVVSDVALQVAAEQIPMGPRGTVSLSALVAAAVALVGSAGAFVSVAGRQRAAGRGTFTSGGA